MAEKYMRKAVVATHERSEWGDGMCQRCDRDNERNGLINHEGSLLDLLGGE